MYTIAYYLKSLINKSKTALKPTISAVICSRFHKQKTTPLTMVDQPSLSDLRSRRYLKKSASEYTHSRLWESSKSTRVTTLRLDKDFFTYLDKQKGPKGRRSNRVVGPTPDESYVQRGRPAYNYSHQIRKELSRLFTMGFDTLVVMLYQNPHYKSGLKKAHPVRLPDLSRAMNELLEELLIRDERLLGHPVFNRMGAPAMCRLLEIRSMYQLT